MFLSIYLITFTTYLTPLTALRHDFTQDIESYVNLVSDIQQYYKTRSICIIYDNPEDLLLTTKLLKIVRLFSNNQRFSQGINQLDFIAKYNSSFSIFSRQLFVLPFTNEKVIKNFEDFTKTHELSFHIWLIIFWSLLTKMPGNFCEEPKNDRFNLNINTRMLVKCHGNPVIREWYSVTEYGEIKTRDQFAWKPELGFIRRGSRRLFERRHDFNGRVIRIASVEDPDYPPSMKKYHGQSFEFIRKLMEELSIHLNFTIKQLPPIDAYGLWNKTEKKWTGILGKLVANEIDVAVTELIMTAERKAAFDFTWPLIISQNRLYIKKPDAADVQWNVYMKAFNMSVWASIVVLIIIAPIFLTFIKIQIKGIYYLKRLLTENYLYVWGIYCQQGLSDYSESSVLKIAYFSIFLSAMIISSIYSASLISYLTTVMPAMPFKSVPEFIKDGSYKLIVIRNSAEHELFMSDEKIVYAGMNRLLKKDEELPTNYVRGFKQVCNEKVAFYANEAMQIKISEKIPCKLASILAGEIRYMAIGLRKNSPLTNFLKYYIRRFEENGVMKRIKNKYAKIHNSPEPSYESVELWKIAPVFAILIFGSAISIVIMLLERRYYKLNHTDRNRVSTSTNMKRSFKY